MMMMMKITQEITAFGVTDCEQRVITGFPLQAENVLHYSFIYWILPNESHQIETSVPENKHIKYRIYK